MPGPLDSVTVTWTDAASIEAARAARRWLAADRRRPRHRHRRGGRDLVRRRGSLHAMPAARSARMASCTARTSSATAMARSSTFAPAPSAGGPPNGRSGPSPSGLSATASRSTCDAPVIDLAAVTVEQLEADPYPDLRGAAGLVAGRVHALPGHVDGHELGDRRGRVHGSGRVPGARRALADGSCARRDLDDDHRRRARQAAATPLRPHPPPAGDRGDDAGDVRAPVPRAARRDRPRRCGRPRPRLLRAGVRAVARPPHGHRRRRRRTDARPLVRRAGGRRLELRGRPREDRPLRRHLCRDRRGRDAALRSEARRPGRGPHQPPRRARPTARSRLAWRS